MNDKGTYQVSIEAIKDTHVESSIEMINKAISLSNSRFAAVLGCGLCNDIPVQTLVSGFNHIDFVDFNIHSLKAIKREYRKWIETRNIFSFYNTDLTGLAVRIESKGHEIITQNTKPLPCLSELGQLLTSGDPDFWRPPTGIKYDLIICSAVLTQLEAGVRQKLTEAFLNKFPEHKSELSSYEPWRKATWDFARRLEDAFIDHLDLLLMQGGTIYLSDTVNVCWLLQPDPNTFASYGAWIATRTSRLADYLRPWHEILTEGKWNWVWRGQEGPYKGRLYGVQAIIYKISSHNKTKVYNFYLNKKDKLQ